MFEGIASLPIGVELRSAVRLSVDEGPYPGAAGGRRAMAGATPTELSVLPPVCAGELVLTAPRIEAPRALSEDDILRYG